MGAMNGICDIGMASRGLKDSEKEVLADVCIAVDGIAVIINLENPISQISSESIRQIFTCEVSDWNEISP